MQGPSTTPQKPISSAQLALKLNRSVATLERWRRARIGPPFYSIMGRVVYDENDCDAWLAQQKQETGRRHAA